MLSAQQLKQTAVLIASLGCRLSLHSAIEANSGEFIRSQLHRATSQHLKQNDSIPIPACNRNRRFVQVSFLQISLN